MGKGSFGGLGRARVGVDGGADLFRLRGVEGGAIAWRGLLVNIAYGRVL